MFLTASSGLQLLLKATFNFVFLMVAIKRLNNMLVPLFRGTF